MKNLFSPKKAVIILSFFCSAMVSAHTIDNGVLIIDEGTTALEPREFYGNTEITSILFPSSLTKIGNLAFCGCTELTEVEIPGTVTEIQWSAFNACKNLKSAKIGDGTTTIGNMAFYGTGLQSISLPNTIKSIGDKVFPSSTFIDAPTGSFAQEWAYQNNYAYSIEYTIEDSVLIIPEGTTRMPARAFVNADIKDVKIPSTLDTIRAESFMYCMYLNRVEIPNNVKAIHSKAFDCSVNLRKVIVPSSVDSIGAKAFCHNATLVVEENSYAHKWAVANGYDYQFTEEGLPVGVSEMIVDYFVPVAWNQRGGRNQFSHQKENVVCGNMAHCIILYQLGIVYEGSRCYATPDTIFYADFDKNHPDYSKIPLCFMSTYSDEKMRDADLHLFNQGMVYELDWIHSEQRQKYPDWLPRMEEHAPIRVEQYTTDFEGDYSEGNNGNDLSPKDIEDKIVANLKAGKPLWHYARRASDGNSHAFVLDGARIKNGEFQVHCNFGFTGDDDGWFDFRKPMLVYDDLTFRKIVEYELLEGEELAAWKPFRLTDEQVANIKADTANKPFIKDGHLHIPEGTTFVLQKEFLGNKDLTSIYLPSTMRSVGSTAFKGCENLTEITIPESIERLVDLSFADCSNLKTVYFNAINCSYMGSGNSITTFRGDSLLSDIIIGDKVTLIPNRAFRDLPSLKKIVIPGNVKTIGHYAFASSPLTDVCILDGVKTIGNYAFSGTALTSICLPASIDSIGTGVFPKGINIICEEGSYAESYAIANKLSYEYGKCFCNDDSQIDDATAVNIIVAPNPTSNGFTIHGVNNGIAKLYDVNGALVMQKEIDGDTYIDISPLAKGIYVLDINGITSKLVKE